MGRVMTVDADHIKTQAGCVEKGGGAECAKTNNDQVMDW